MPRKGTSYLLKIGFPTPPPERKQASQEKATFKDNWENCDPPKQVALPVPQQNMDEEVPGEYYQIGLSSLEGHIVSVEGKVAGILANPEMSPSNVKKVARKIGRSHKFLKSVKTDLKSFETRDAALDVPQEQHALEQDMEQEEKDGLGEAIEVRLDGDMGPGVEATWSRKEPAGQGWSLPWSWGRRAGSIKTFYRISVGFLDSCICAEQR